MLECENAVCIREISVIFSSFTGCCPAVGLPLQSAAPLRNQNGFVFSFLRMSCLLLGETVLRGSRVTLIC